MNIESELREAARQWIESGGSQTKLAEAAGVSQSAVSDFIRGSGIRLHIAERIAATVGRPLKLSGRRRSTANG